jgi:signal transduction histidine kinase
VQSDAAQAALEYDPARAEAPLGTIRSSAREALTDMRRLLGVLREQNSSAELEPLPGLAQIESLVARFPTARLHVEGSLVGLPPSLDLGAYRIVQEALTNAAKHAAGATVDVRLRRTEAALEIDVSDDGPGPSGSPSPDAHGLVGMRERARLHGGSLDARAGENGGFRVHATLPLVGS